MLTISSSKMSKFRTHIVQHGEWIGSLALEHGFSRSSDLWEHPLNAGIRELRTSADVLMAGDKIRIPADKRSHGIEVRAGTRVVFQVRRPDALKIRLVTLLPVIEARGELQYKLELGDETYAGTLTQDNLTIEVPLAASDTRATLTVEGMFTREFVVGGLGPVQEREGAHARLFNLGYALSDKQDPHETVCAGQTAAVAAFQRAHGLPCDGELSEGTCVALDKAYSE